MYHLCTQKASKTCFTNHGPHLLYYAFNSLGIDPASVWQEISGVIISEFKSGSTKEPENSCTMVTLVVLLRFPGSQMGIVGSGEFSSFHFFFCLAREIS